MKTDFPYEMGHWEIAAGFAWIRAGAIKLCLDTTDGVWNSKIESSIFFFFKGNLFHVSFRLYYITLWLQNLCAEKLSLLSELERIKSYQRGFAIYGNQGHPLKLPISASPLLVEWHYASSQNRSYLEA